MLNMATFLGAWPDDTVSPSRLSSKPRRVYLFVWTGVFTIIIALQLLYFSVAFSSVSNTRARE